MDIINFRPISLLTSSSKILEKVIYGRLYQHINQNNILATEQYGFRNKFSTENTFFKLINEILLALNNKWKVDGLFCDLENTFNYINYLLNITADPSKPILFADDTSMIIKILGPQNLKKILTI